MRHTAIDAREKIERCVTSIGMKCNVSLSSLLLASLFTFLFLIHLGKKSELASLLSDGFVFTEEFL